MEKLPGRMPTNLSNQPRGTALLALATPIGRPVIQVSPSQARSLNSGCSEVSLLPRAHMGPSSQGALEKLREGGWQERRRGGCSIQKKAAEQSLCVEQDCGAGSAGATEPLLPSEEDPTLSGGQAGC